MVRGGLLGEVRGGGGGSVDGVVCGGDGGAGG